MRQIVYWCETSILNDMMQNIMRLKYYAHEGYMSQIGERGDLIILITYDIKKVTH